MKIAMIIPSLKIGGGQRIAMELAGDNPNLFFIIIEKREDNFFARQVEQDHKVYYLDKELGFHGGVFYKIWKILRQEKPELLHFHLGVSLYGLVPAFFLKKIKLIYTFHTIAQNDSVGIIRLLCRMGIKLRGMIPVAISKTVAKSIEQVYRIENVKIIYNGIRLEHYHCSKRKEDQIIKLVTVGQIWEIKNHAFMIDLLRTLKMSGTQSYELTILGDGPLRQQICEKIDHDGLRQQVKVTGNVSNVNDYLADSDIFLLTSHYEGLSLATLEAMASGLPIVSSDVGGMKDLVSDNGFLIESGNMESFVKAIETLASQEKMRESMGQKSLAYVKQYDVKKMRQAYFEFYREVTKNGAEAF